MVTRLLFVLTLLTAQCVNAQMQFLTLPANNKLSAVFPCVAEKRSVNSAIGVTNALQCSVQNNSSFCSFLLMEQPLDVVSFNRNGWRFIEEVHRQYAALMDKNYRNVYEKIIDFGGMGKAYTYELIRMQGGLQVNVRGLWMVSDERLLRGTVSCSPSGTSFLRSESVLFINSLTVVK
jgi:hypothetical protein